MTPATTLRHAALCNCIILVAIFDASASAQTWITFTNQTSTRLADPEGNYPELLTDTQEKDFASGDVDNDVDVDVVLVRKIPYTNPGGRKNYLFLNENGVLTNRTMAKAPQLLDLTNDRDVQLFDANGDGWLDIVTAPTFPQAAELLSIKMPRLYMNLGADANGNWLGFQYNYADQRIPDFPINPFFCSVAYGDVDGDGDQDLFFIDYAADSSVPDPPGGPLKNRLLLNNGSGFFTDVTSTNLLPAPGQPGYSITYDIRGNGFGTRGKIVDMNGDAWPDLLAVDSCSANPRTVRIAKNMGSADPSQPGVFMTGNWSNYALGLSVYDIDVGDINNDGKLDFYEVDDGLDRFYLNSGNSAQGNPIFTAVAFANQTFDTTGGFGGNTYSVDMDGDGWRDQIVCDENVDLALGGNRMTLLHNVGVGPSWLTHLGEPFTLDGTLGTRDTYDVAILDIDGNGTLDLLVGTKTANKVFINGLIPDTTPPTILSSNPASGTLDALQDRSAGGTLQGITALKITFSEPVRDAVTNGPVTTASFSVSLTTNLPGLTPPSIISVIAGPNNDYTLTFNATIIPGAWTTVTSNVEDLSGNPLGPNGIDLAFLPGDVNHDLSANTLDLLACVSEINTCVPAGTCGQQAVLAQYDVNRDGNVSTVDLLRIVQLLNGSNTQNAWNGVSLPPQP